MNMTKTNEEKRAVTEHGPSVQKDQHHLIKSGSLPALNNEMQGLNSPLDKTWLITAEKFSPTNFEGMRSADERWKSISDAHAQLEIAVKAMKDDVDVINQKLLKNNPYDVKKAAERMDKRVKDMLLKISILQNDGKSFGAAILAASQPLKPSEKKDKKRVALSPPEKLKKLKKKRWEEKTPASPRKTKGRGFHDASTENVSDMEVVESEMDSTALQKDGNVDKEGFTLVRRKEKKPKRKKQTVNSLPPKTERKERRNDAIRIKAKDETTYAEILSQMKEKVNPETTETEVIALRRSKQNDVLVILKKGTNTERFSQQLKEALSEKADVTALDYDPKVQVDIRDIQEDSTENEILSSVEGVVGEGAILRCRLKKGFAGTQIATVEMSRKFADLLIKAEKIKIGWVRCRVRLRDVAVKCYRCLGFGHIARGCSRPDRADSCYKCGADDHKVKDCENEAICVACKDSNYVHTDHVLGSRACRSIQEELARVRRRM